LVNWRNYNIDDVPQALVPVSLWRDGTVRLDLFRDYYESLPADSRYPFREIDGHLYPRNSVFDSLLIAPLYLPPVLLGMPTKAVNVWIVWGGVSAAIGTAVAVALSYLTLRRMGTEAAALSLSLLMAFGTCLWTTVGHMVYDHLGGAVCIAALTL